MLPYARVVAESPIDVARRFDAVNASRDREAFYALLTDDAEWTTPYRTLRGLDEIREKLDWSPGEPPENLDIEFEEGEWVDEGDGCVARENRVVQRWKETGEIATVILQREQLDIRDSKISRYSRRGRPEQS
jgi:hypothetical protein